MVSRDKRWAWSATKLVAALALFLYIGVRIRRDLEGLDLTSIELRPGWLFVAGGLYLIGLLPQAWFWRHVLGAFGYPLAVYPALRAHLISQLGKYVPGKALALLMRADLVHPHGVPYGVAVIVSIYEILTGLSAGAMVASILFIADPPRLITGMPGHPALLGLALLALCALPLTPGVFNGIIAKLTARIQAMELYRLPPLRSPTLALGLLASGAGWWIQGLSVWATFQAIMPEPGALTLSSWAQCTAAIAFANAVGFVIFILPAGIGVREEIMRNLLGDAGPVEYVAMAVILVRLDWLLAEALIAPALWLVPARNPQMSCVSGGPSNQI